MYLSLNVLLPNPGYNHVLAISAARHPSLVFGDVVLCHSLSLIDAYLPRFSLSLSLSLSNTGQLYSIALFRHP